MTKEEFISEKKKIESKYKQDLSKLEMDYCMSKTKYHVGDIVEDHLGAVKLIKINCVWHSYTNGNLSLAFIGEELRKSDFQKKKNGSMRDVFEDNIQKIIKSNEE